jgi:putative flippase GtrA
MVQYLHIFPTVSKIITTVIIVSFSFLSQKHFTFRVRKVTGPQGME